MILLYKFLNILLSPIFGLIRLQRGFKGLSVMLQKINTKRDILLWKLMIFNPLLKIDIHFRDKISSDIPLDIFIPVSEKDIGMLNKVLDGVIAHVKHPINKIYIVSKQNKNTDKICKKYNATFIDELDVLGYGPQNIDYNINLTDRSGWLFQQLLKLNADEIVEMENYLILDADTVFIRPKIFIYKNRTILDQSLERHEPYHDAYEKILGKKTTSLLSFITHYMLFNKTCIKKLKTEIENFNGKRWDIAIKDNVIYSDASGFSEYELYGNYVTQLRPNFRIKREFWFNSTSIKYLKQGYLKSVSFHAYLKK